MEMRNISCAVECVDKVEVEIHTKTNAKIPDDNRTLTICLLLTFLH